MKATKKSLLLPTRNPAHTHTDPVTLTPTLSSPNRPTRLGRHGGEQQHHGVHQLHRPALHDPRRRDGPVAAVEAGRGLRAPGTVAGRRRRRAAPARRADGLPRRVLEPEGPAGLLSLRHGRAHHAAPGAPRLRLHRHAGVRRAARAGARVRGLSAPGVLCVAAPVRRRRPAPVGGDHDLHRRLRHVQEARAGHHLHRAGAVLRVAPLANPGNSFTLAFE
jgi:hypothetical protein